MNIYMIHPRFSDSHWPILPWWSSPHHRDSMDQWNLIDVMGVDAYMPPTALTTLAALTPPDIRVEIVDHNAGTPVDYLKDCDLVCLTAYGNQIPEARRIAQRFQQRGIPVALGGPQASTAPHECGFVDHLFVGEAELTWPRFLEDLKAGRAQAVYEQAEKIDMRISPIPRWDLVDLHRYDAGIVQTTRGCPFDCEYCDVIVFNGRKPRHKPIETVLEDIRRQHAGGAERIFLSDDNLIGDKGYAKQLLAALTELNETLDPPMQYICQLTINVAHDEALLRAFADANFIVLFIGVETPRTASLLSAKKPQNTIRDLRTDLRRIGAYGMVPVTGLINGFDTDDEGIFAEQLEFIGDVPLLITRTNILTAIPHTALWHRLRQEGRLVDEDTRARDPSPMLPNFQPRLMSRETLYRRHLALLEEIWSVENMEKRLVAYLEQIEYLAPVARRRPSARQVAILPRLMKRVVRAPREERRLLLRTLGHALRIQPLAMRQALFAYINGIASRNVARSVIERERRGAAPGDAPLEGPTPVEAPAFAAAS